jgi:uncharacterized protein YkwD
MGRHGRSAARPAPVEDDPGHPTTPLPRAASRRRRRKKAPLRTGLLGASAAMAVGAVAVASGLIPGGGGFNVAGGPGDEHVRADGSPADLLQQGGVSASPTATGAQAEGTLPPKTPAPGSSSTAAKKPSHAPTAKKSPPPTSASGTGTAQAPSSKAPAPPTATRNTTLQAPAAPADASAAAQILTMVNQERAKVGCSPLKDDPSLDSLAQNFSDEMAARGFFDHTDPDGKTPWDRADAAGVKNLGGENIARGQADAQAVMDAWMNSAGHRANILNCDYTRLGVGIHYGTGGPWWTQDFGF